MIQNQSTTNPLKLPLEILLSLMMVTIGALHLANPEAIPHQGVSMSDQRTDL